MSEITGDKLRGHLETMILSVLERGQTHGLEILHQMEQAGCGILKLKEGSLYPALYRLEAAGLIQAEWEDEPHGRRGARRRFYRLTPKGKRKLIKGREEWVSFVQIIGGILGAASMNEAILIQLKTIVERTVRPVRAPLARKRKMREELLSHLIEVYDEELPKQGNEQAALLETEKRFGDPTRVRQELQITVSYWDRYRAATEGIAPSCDSMLPMFHRSILAMLVVNALALVVVVWSWMFPGSMGEFAPIVYESIPWSVAVVVVSLLFIFIADRFTRTLQGQTEARSRPKAIFYSFASALILTALTVMTTFLYILAALAGASLLATASGPTIASPVLLFSVMMVFFTLSYFSSAFLPLEIVRVLYRRRLGQSPSQIVSYVLVALLPISIMSLGWLASIKINVILIAIFTICCFVPLPILSWILLARGKTNEVRLDDEWATLLID